MTYSLYMSNERGFQLVKENGETILTPEDHRDIGNAIMRCIQAAMAIFGKSYAELTSEERDLVIKSLKDGNQNLN